MGAVSSKAVPDELAVLVGERERILSASEAGSAAYDVWVAGDWASRISHAAPRADSSALESRTPSAPDAALAST